MGDLLLFAMLGLGVGALVAGLSLGVVLNHRGSGVVNLGLGAVAMVGAYLFYGLRTGGYLFIPSLLGLPDRIPLGPPWPVVPALVLAVAVCGGLGALFDHHVLRRLRSAPALARLITTLGVLVLGEAIVQQVFGTTGQAAPSVLPEGGVPAFGEVVPVDRFLLAAIVIVITAALTLAFWRTRFGLASRAASENEVAAILAGHSPDRISLVNTTAAFTLAGAVGVLVAPLTQLDSSTLALAIVPALGAALLARFSSFPIAAATGFALGILESLVTYLQTKPWFPTSDGLPIQGVPDVIFLLVIVGALVWRGRSLPERGAIQERRLPRAPRPERILRPAAIGSVLAVLALLLLSSADRQAVIFTLIALIACLSIVVVVGYVGQVSVAQLALAGVAGFVVSKMAVQAHIGFPLGPLAGVLIATLVGTVLALPALRVRGVNLAIVTMAAGVAITNFGFDNSRWGASEQGSPVPSPHLFGLDLGNAAPFPVGGDTLPSPLFGLFCLVVAVFLALLVASLRRSHLGQAMLAVRGNERAAAAAGIDVTRVKLTAFAASAFIAGFAGVLYAYNFNSVSGSRFDLGTALNFFSFAYIFGVGAVAGAVAASLGATQGVIPHFVNDIVVLSTPTQMMIGGVGLMLSVVANPDGVAVSEKKGPPPPLNLFLWIYRQTARRFRAAAAT